jgi:membrane-associated protein
MNFNVFNTTDFLQNASYLGLFLGIFAETGLLIGLILPGESLLLTAGVLSAVGFFNIWLVLWVTFIAAVLADSIAYAVGKYYGPRVFVRKNSLFFNQSYVEQAQEFYNRRGGRTLVIARFLPFIRTVAPIMAGIGRMRYSVFFLYNIIGAFLWTFIIGLAGYEIGERIPNLGAHGEILVLLIAAVCLLPIILGILKDKNTRNKIRSIFRK